MIQRGFDLSDIAITRHGQKEQTKFFYLVGKYGEKEVNKKGDCRSGELLTDAIKVKDKTAVLFLLKKGVQACDLPEANGEASTLLELEKDASSKQIKMLLDIEQYINKRKTVWYFLSNIFCYSSRYNKNNKTASAALLRDLLMLEGAQRTSKIAQIQKPYLECLLNGSLGKILAKDKALESALRASNKASNSQSAVAR